MSESPYSYHHSPLPQGSYIRLLRLIPHEDEAAPIQCQLFNYSLHESSKKSHLYEALSYAWGDLDKPLSISIDKDKLPVTVNLHAALSHLRDPFLERILWVDAICIDQEDLEEQSCQVQLMAKIYSKANRVIVWLGESEPGSDQALEDICHVASGESTGSSKEEVNQQAILNLLQRPWFERIWVLQEVAAARHVVIMCGSTEIEGFAFCLGLKSLDLPYTDVPELQALFSITYLIEQSGLRSKYTTNSRERFSSNISCLAELIDMFHSRKATKIHDKVYALLGMSSDDPGEAGLRPDYEIPWKNLFQQLVKFILGKDISVDTSDDNQRAVIQSHGRIIGLVSSVSDDRQNVNITYKDTAWYIEGVRMADEKRCTLQASAISIREGDIICLLQGALKPTIIRPCKDHFAVILIAAALSNENEHSGFLELPKSTIQFPYKFLLIWDWEKPLGELQGQEEYKALANNSQFSKYSKAEFGEFSGEAIRMWNVAVILGAMGRMEESRGRLQEIFESNGMAFNEVYGYSLDGQYGLTPLSLAAMEGQETIVEELLTKDGIDPDLKDSRYGQTPLAWAASRRQEAVVKLLLKTGRVDISSINYKGKTPLLTAFDSYFDCDVTDAIVKPLLEKGADIMARDCLGSTVLHLAVETGDQAAVVLLLDMGADITAQDNTGETALHKAAKLRSYNDIVKLLLKKGADITTKDYSGKTALHSAAHRKGKESIELLLENGADITAQDNTGQTALHKAAKLRSYNDIVKLLLKKGADITTKDYSGKTALHLAAHRGRGENVKLLLKNGADITAQTNSGATPLHLGARWNESGMIKLLLEKGADMTTKYHSGATALHSAAHKGRKENVELLLKNGADITLRTNSGITPLHLATESGSMDTVSLLLDYGADIEVKDDSGWTALHRAAFMAPSPRFWWSENVEVVELLLARGADVTARNNEGNTALNLVKGECRETANLLENAERHARLYR